MIKPETGGFDGDKLKFARELNGLTLAEVAKKMNVSHQFVSKWEKGKSIPSFEQSVQLGNLLKLGRFFFFSPLDLPKSSGTTFFRRNVSVTKKNRIQAETSVRLYAYVESQLSRQLKLPYFSEPEFAVYQHEFNQIDPERIEDIADKVRAEFNLDNGPVSNVTLLTERLGIRVAFRDLSAEQIDAVTEEIDGKKYIVINIKHRSSVRIRFNLAHELGHIFLHSAYAPTDVEESSNRKRIEWEANYFASCLLMPEAGIAQDMVYANLEYLKALKKHWLVSIQALVTRGLQLELIGEVQGLHLRQEISRRGWRKKEPLDETIPIEYPQYIKSAIKYSGEDVDSLLTMIGQDVRLSTGKVARQVGVKEFTVSEPIEKSGLRLIR